MMTGERVRLRPIERSDLEKLNLWKNDEEVYAYLGGGFQPASKDIQEKWMDALMDLSGNDRRFMIEIAEGCAIGMVGLYGINWVHRNCEIGVYIGDRTQWGKGYAYEACCLIEEYAAKCLNLRKINLKVVSGNDRAEAMWKKLGYRQVGEFTDERYIRGEYRNVKMMEKFLMGGYCAHLINKSLWEAAA